MTPTVSLIVRSPAVTPPQGLAARLRNLRDRAAAGEDIVTPVTAAELDLMGSGARQAARASHEATGAGQAARQGIGTMIANLHNRGVDPDGVAGPFLAVSSLNCPAQQWAGLSRERA